AGAKSGGGAVQKSSPAPCGSKVGPGDINSRRRRSVAATLKPPNGGRSFWRVASSDLRSTGSLASAAREVTALGSTPASWDAQPGALKASAMRSGNRPKKSRSRSSGSRGSRESGWRSPMRSHAGLHSLRALAALGRDAAAELRQPALAPPVMLALAERFAPAFGHAEIELLDVLVLAQRLGLTVEHHAAVFEH